MSAGSPSNVPPDSPATRRFDVAGMTCAGCSTRLDRVLSRIPGVTAASVSLVDGTARVTGTASDEAVVAAIEGAGFEGSPRDASDGGPTHRLSELERRQTEHERAWARRAAAGLLIWVPMVIVHWTAGHGLATWWTLAGLATLSVIWVGTGFYRSTVRALARGGTNMDTLIALGATTAYIASLVQLVLVTTGRSEGPPVLYFGETGGLFALVSLGHWLEARAGARANSAIRELLELQPDQACRLESDGTEEWVPSVDLAVGDRVRLRPGERVPVDGVVTGGASELDVSAVTGESILLFAGPGEQVVAGSLNTNGTLVVRATTDGRNTTITRIADLVADAQSSKARIQRLADRVSSIFVPIVIGIALATVLGWWLLGDDLPRGIIATVTVLVISCPCALGLATPMAITVAAGTAGRHGILIRSAGAIERAGAASRIVFDKTGTLTEGELAVTAIETLAPGVDERSILIAAAAVEAASEHPIARAIGRAAEEHGVPLRPVRAFRATPGEGVFGIVDEIPVAVQRDPDGGSACVVSAHGRPIGRVHVADRPRREAADVIRALRKLGVAPSMLTGDRRAEALEMAARLGLTADEVTSDARPDDKHALVRSAGPGTIMVGDGINDAAALAEADLGIAVSNGTSIAMESAGVVLTAASIRTVPVVVRLARATLRTIRQNLVFSFAYNVAAIPAAAFGLLGERGPLIAAIAMGLSNLTVVGNALRLRPKIEQDARAAEDAAAEDDPEPDELATTIAAPTHAASAAPPPGAAMAGPGDVDAGDAPQADAQSEGDGDGERDGVDDGEDESPGEGDRPSGTRPPSEGPSAERPG